MLSTSKRSYFTVAVKYSKGSFPFTKFFFASCHNGYIINLQPTFEKCIFETLFKARFWFVSTWVFAKSVSHHFICFFSLKKRTLNEIITFMSLMQSSKLHSFCGQSLGGVANATHTTGPGIISIWLFVIFLKLNHVQLT